MNDWTNAVKAGVIAVVNTGMALALTSAIFLGWEPNIEAFSALSFALEAFVNSALGLWMLLTYKLSNARIRDPKTLKERGLKV